MIDRNSLVILLIYFFIFVVFIFPIILSGFNGTDAHRHLVKANNCIGIESANWSKESCEGYAPLLSIFLFLFKSSPQRWIIGNFLIIGIFTPLTIYFLTGKKWQSIFFYFTSTSYFFYMIDGIYSQAFAMLLALLFINSKKYSLEELAAGIFLIFSHGHGLILTLLIFFVKRIDYVSYLSSLCSSKTFCLGLLGKAVLPKELTEELNIVGGISINLSNYIHILIRVTPFYFVFLAIISFVEKKRIDYILFLLFGLIGTLFVSIRTSYFSALIMVIGLSFFYDGLSKNSRIILFSTSLVLGMINLYAYFNLKWCIVS